MDDTLRVDLLAIILEEAFGYTEEKARHIAANGPTRDHASYDAAILIIDRFASRCSRIDG